MEPANLKLEYISIPKTAPEAKALAEQLAKECGPGWVPDIWYNCQWCYAARGGTYDEVLAGVTGMVTFTKNAYDRYMKAKNGSSV